MPSYVANPFAAAAPGAKSEAYAGALRNYAPNQFAGTAGAGQTAMAPHLSQPIPLDPDLIAAYKHFQTDPQAQQYSQSGVDLQKLWGQSPNAPIFKPGYEHNPFVMQHARQAGQKRDLDARMAAMSPAEQEQYRMQEYWNANTQIA